MKAWWWGNEGYDEIGYGCDGKECGWKLTTDRRKEGQKRRTEALKEDK